MPSPHRPPSVPFMGLQLARITQKEFVEWIIDRAHNQTTSSRIGYLNAAQVNLANSDPNFRRDLESFDCLYADGQAVVWAARFLGGPIPERVNAGDFTAEFFNAAAAAGLKLSLIGGRPGVAERFAARYLAQTPNLKIAPIHPGYFAPGGEEAVRAAVESADPDIVLIGMGAPLQESLARSWSEKGAPRVWWCVGALFEYDAGERARAPVWMRRAGLEWLFRLALEPRRLAGRYLMGNPKFVLRVLRERIWHRS